MHRIIPPLKHRIQKFTFLLFALVFFQAGFAQVRLPILVRDSMVLQRDVNINIWGWAAPGEKIKLSFNKKNYKATTDVAGKWLIVLPAQQAGGPFDMHIDASNHIILSNILVGDVWLCSGQSNMVHQMFLHADRYANDITTANYPEIRHFFIPTLTNMQSPQEDLPTGYWKSAVPADVGQFSAVAYFFARDIYNKYHIPIGLINASVGGTPIEAWTSEDGLKDFSNIVPVIQRNKDTAYVNSTNRAAFAAGGNRPRSQDKGMMGSVNWFDTNYIPKGWHTINIPGYWEDQGVKDLDGIVWYRREIDVPASMTGIPAQLNMGRIVDADNVYINGKAVGNTTYQYPQRRYPLPAGTLKTGKNIIVIRVTNNSGKGGFVPDKPYNIAAGAQSIDLKGEWHYKVGDVFVRRGRGGGGAFPISQQNQPTALYNAMIAPLINYSVKGFYWYQGEANSGNGGQYGKLLTALIADWRKKWNEGDLPFIYVQLPGFMDVDYQPSESQWALVREGMLKTLSVPNTAMVVAIDLGEWNDIHPGDKKDVGDRTALAAEKIAYGEKDIVYSGPIYLSNSIEGNKIRISFTNTGSGLITNDGEAPSQFAIAGADKKFAWASTRIEGNAVVVWSDEVTSPMYVRYAWADNPRDANLFNKEGLPASPFRTDAEK